MFYNDFLLDMYIWKLDMVLYDKTHNRSQIHDGFTHLILKNLPTDNLKPPYLITPNTHFVWTMFSFFGFMKASLLQK